jgi:hypothetical protein
MIIAQRILEYNDLWSKVYKVPVFFSDSLIKDDSVFEVYRLENSIKKKDVYVYCPVRLFPFIDAEVVVFKCGRLGFISSMTDFRNNEHFHFVIKKELSKFCYKEILQCC